MANGPSPEFLRQQLDQAINTYRSGLTVIVQIITVMIVANVSVWGYALNYKIGGMLYLGAIFPLLIFYLIKLVGRLLAPSIYTAYQVEKMLSGSDREFLMRTGISVIADRNLIKTLNELTNLESGEERIKRLRDLRLDILGERQFIVYIILFFISGIQLAAPIFLARMYNWPIFELYQ